MPCSTGMAKCKALCLHRELVQDYRNERQRQEIAADEASLGYETERASYVEEHPLITFKSHLIARKRPVETETTDQPELPAGTTTEHDIEQTAKVYLEWDIAAGAWKIDPITGDYEPLDGNYEGTICDYSHDTDAEKAECQALVEKADRENLPNALELFMLLAAQLGYTVKPT